MALLWILRILSLGVVIGAGAITGNAIYQRYFAWSKNPAAKLRLPITVPLAAIGFGFFLVFMSAVYVTPNHIAVVADTANGSFKEIGSGIHLWPLDTNVPPFVSRVTQYDLRRHQIEIGTEKSSPGVGAASSSPGNPEVFIQARGWATPNPAKVIQLHRKYGADYLNGWVERNWVTAVKAVQGQHEYNYLAGNRDQMAAEIERNLQQQLLDTDGTPLVFVSQLAITNYGYAAQVQQQLDQIAQKEFDSQKAARDVAIAQQRQIAANVDADTRIQVAKKDGEATIAAANAEAQAIKAKYGDSAEAQAYINYQWIQRWNGQLPTTQLGANATPLIPLPGGK